jgi:hypothetical protein
LPVAIRTELRPTKKDQSERQLLDLWPARATCKPPSQIEQFSVPVSGDNDVGRFDVAMLDAHGVRGFQRAADLSGDIQDIPNSRGP